MKLDIAGVVDQIGAFYGKLPLSQKIALPLVFVGSVMLLVFVSRWGSRPDYAVLYSGLQTNDSAAVITALKEKKVGYRLRDDGSVIEITPPSLVSELRLELASTGIPQGDGEGFELFNELPLGMTRAWEKVTGLRALQGELAKTIKSIKAVESARVHITTPDRSVFAKRDAEATASVLLKLKRGEELSPRQIKGIVNLVAGAVERLKSANVTILDETGRMLNETPEASDLGVGDVGRLDYQKKLEQEFSRRIESMLSEILGPGKAIARVTADLDFSQYQKEEEVYDPGGVVMRSEQVVEEGAQKNVGGGVPGVISNLTNDPQLLNPPSAQAGESKRQEATRNFEVSRSVAHSVAATGKIVRLTAAVLVDGQRTASATIETEGATQPATENYEALPPEMMKQIDRLVKQAIGFDSSRGDIVTVENIRFFEQEDKLHEFLADKNDLSVVIDALPWAFRGLALFLLFVVLILPVVRFLTRPTESEVDLSRLLPSGLEELEVELESERAKTSKLPESPENAVDIEELEELLAENSSIVAANPQQAALLIKYWLNEGR